MKQIILFHPLQVWLRTVSFWILALAAIGLFPLLGFPQNPNATLNYQGRVSVGDVVFEGNGHFKFALLNRAGDETYWSNDGTSASGSEPEAAIELPIVRGLYSVGLGDTELANMSAISPEVFENVDLRLRIWFDDGVHGFQQLSPDQPLAPTAYALSAKTATEAASVAAGSIGVQQLDPAFEQNLAKLDGDTTFSGTVTAEGFSGDGSGLTNLPAAAWETVSGTAHTAAVNRSYLLTNDEFVMLTLPVDVKAGDMVTVTGSGKNGWAVVPGVGQHFVGRASVDAIWTSRESERNWRAVASSADGSKLVAAVYGGHVFTSSDSGASWTPRMTDSVQGWMSVASSADGSKIFAVNYWGEIYRSDDSGETWINPSETFDSHYSTAASADGSKLVTGGIGPIWTSIDSGETWQMRGEFGFWRSVASSADGTKLAAVTFQEVTGLYTSTDSGESWIKRLDMEDLRAVTSSVDGSRLVATAIGGIFTSSDFGVTWTASVTEEGRHWTDVASSADGRNLVVVENNGGILMSDDFGITWTARMTDENRPWQAVASSASGDKLVAVAEGGRIYTSSGETVEAEKTVQGGPGTTASFQYLGNGAWLPLADAVVGIGAIGSDQLADGSVTAAKIAGELNADQIPSLTTDHLPMIDASKIATGILDDARLFGNVAKLDADQEFVGVNEFTNPANRFSGDGSGLTNLPTAAWETVSGIAHTAVVNRSYLLTNDDSTLELPIVAENGDVVTVSGGGEENSRVVSYLPLEANASGLKWKHLEEGLPSSFYYPRVAISADGSRFILNGFNHALYRSADRGKTWVENAEFFGWRSVASSADGKRLLGSVGSRLYVSGDFGETWVEILRGDLSWESVASSADGRRLMAAMANRHLYVSDDYGANWLPVGLEKAWHTVEISADGTRLFAASRGEGIYVSTDFGQTWEEGNEPGRWTGLSVSADGSRLVAVTNADYLFTSADGGVHWENRGYFGWWYDVSSSADGRIVAAANSQGVHLSTDYGATWTQINDQKEVSEIGLSADGRLLLVAATDRVLLGTNEVSAEFMPGSVQKFQYVDGEWKSLLTPVGQLAGTIEDRQLPASVARLDSSPVFTGSVTASAFSGDGSGLANLDAAAIASGVIDSARLPDTVPLLEDGLLPDSFLNPNIARLDADQAFTGASEFSNSANRFTGDGSGLTNLAAAAWETVFDTAHTAEANRSYLLTNSGNPTLTLPESAEVGDIVTVSGSGTSPWKVQVTEGHTILGSSGDPGPWQSAGSGIETSGGWRSLVASADGTTMVTTDHTYVYVSHNGGATWARQSPRAILSMWRSVALSADGAKLFAAGLDGVYTSFDGGANWVERLDANLESVSASADGSMVVAVGTDGIYTSTDSGVSWTEQVSDEVSPWSVSSSADGSRLVIGGSRIHTSEDSGVTWVEKRTLNFDSWNYGLDDVAVISPDGQKIVAFVTGGQIHTSDDFGETWTLRGPFLNWSAISWSADGTTLIAATSGADGDIFLSKDDGSTWIPQHHSGNWNQVGISGDGGTLMAGSIGGLQVARPVATFEGAPGTTVSFQFIHEHGIWRPVGQSASQIVGTVDDARLSANIARLDGDATFTGTVRAVSFAGDGAGLAGLDASSLTAGILADERLSGNVARLDADQTFSGINEFSNPANSFTGIFNGDGSGLSNFSASGIASGTIDDARLPGNLAKVDADQTFSGINEFSNPANSFSGDGSGLTNLSAAGWETVSGTEQQAVANRSYLLTSGDYPSLTLPPLAEIGDIVTVAGSENGWTVRSADGSLGWLQVFTENEGFGAWQALASSADGSKVMGVGSRTPVFTSKNFGETWTPEETASHSWWAVDSSADGSKLIAVAHFAKIHLSTDSGKTWIEAETERRWMAAASSADGSRLITAAYDDHIYISDDFGANWTAREEAREWTAVASSADGSLLVAAAAGTNGGIFTSEDFGETWTQQAESRDWRDVASSADGTILIAAAWNTGDPLYTSHDSGKTWVARDEIRGWQSVAISEDGMRLAAADGNGKLYVSDDSGLNWTATGPVRGWRVVTLSADGSRLVAAASDGRLFIYDEQSEPDPVNYVGSKGESMQYQYLGRGEWQLLTKSASQITGTIDDSHLSANIARLDGNATFSGTVTAESFSGDGSALTNISLSGIDSGGAISVSSPSSLFIAGDPLSAGGQSYAIISADFNGDGHPDLVGTDGVNDQLLLYLNNGEGTFESPVFLAVGSGPSSVVAADYNGDGSLDLASADGASDTIIVLPGNGDGTFGDAIETNIGASAFRLATADVDGDGNADLIVSTYFFGNQIRVLLGNGDGTFTEAPGSPNTVDQSPTNIAIADIDGDGFPDLVTPNLSNHTLTILYNDGSGRFDARPPSVEYVGREPYWVAAADLNCDGHIDLVSADSGSNTLTVLLNNGDGTFSRQPPVWTGDMPAFVLAEDLTGDGVPDLVSAHGANTTITVFPGNGDGTFGPGETYVSGNSPSAIANADFNGDGGIDLAIANAFDSHVTVLRNNTIEPEIAVAFTGDGSGLTDLNASAITGGVIDSSRLPLNVPLLESGFLPDGFLSQNIAKLDVNQEFTGYNHFTNPSNKFTGDGSGLTDLDASAITGGVIDSSRLPINVPLLEGGFLPDGFLSQNIARLDVNQEFTGYNHFTNPSNKFTGDGSGLTDLDASAITGGVIASSRLPINVPLLESGFLPDGFLSQNIARLDSSLTFSEEITFSTEIVAASGIRMNDESIWFRGGTDLSHGLGRYGPERPFIGHTTDGPVLFGWNGGSLGTTDGGETTALTWNRHRNVGIATGLPQSRLHVKQSRNAHQEDMAAPGIRIERSGSGTQAYWDVFTGSNGDLNFLSSSGGSATINPANGEYAIGSDRSLKKQIEPLDAGLDAVLALRPTSYRFKTEDDDAPRSFGFIAQEVEEILPEIVSENGDYKGLAYDAFIPVAIRAIQEQQEQIERLEALVIELLKQEAVE